MNIHAAEVKFGSLSDDELCELAFGGDHHYVEDDDYGESHAYWDCEACEALEWFEHLERVRAPYPLVPR